MSSTVVLVLKSRCVRLLSCFQGNAEMAKLLFESYVDDGVEPDYQSYAAMAILYGRYVIPGPGGFQLALWCDMKATRFQVSSSCKY